MKPITVREFVEAMKKNGLPKVTGRYRKYESKSRKEIVGACAIGQAAINLGIDPRILDYRIQPLRSKGLPNIIYLNDHTDKSIQEIGELIEKWANDNNMMERYI